MTGTETKARRRRLLAQIGLGLGAFCVLAGMAGAGGAMAAVALLTATVDRIDVRGPEGVERLTIDSAILGETISLDVLLPTDYAADDGARYPVLWVLDGRGEADHTFFSARALATAGIGRAPIVVSVPSSGSGRRVDFMPPDPAYGELRGEADRFLAFLADEAIPALEQAYRSEAPRMLAGQSLGGLFVSYTLVEQPALFDARFAFSPSWWAGDEAMVQTLSSFIAGGGGGSTYFYASLGAREGNDIERAFERAGAQVGALERTGLGWTHARTPGADHSSNPELSTPAALREFWAAREQ